MRFVLAVLVSLLLLGCHAQAREPEQPGGSESVLGAEIYSPSTPAILTGRMLDRRGAPVDGVEVELFSGNGTLFRRGTMRTEADGRYSFEIEHAAAVHVALTVGS